LLVSLAAVAMGIWGSSWGFAGWSGSSQAVVEVSPSERAQGHVSSLEQMVSLPES
jgi:hypothetical protein